MFNEPQSGSGSLPGEPGGRPTRSTPENGLLAALGLSADEQQALEACASAEQVSRSGADLVREGDGIDRLYVITEGWACRYQMTRDGSRQIVGLVIPGDIANLGSLALHKSNFGVRTLTTAKLIALPIERVNDIAARHCGVAVALVRLALADNAILSRWALCLGRKSAEQRLAHLFCELGVRLAGDRSDHVVFDLPLTQEQIADALGLTSVHVNRTMQNLRGEGLVVSNGRSLTIPDVQRLRSLAEFDPTYLRA